MYEIFFDACVTWILLRPIANGNQKYQKQQQHPPKLIHKTEAFIKHRHACNTKCLWCLRMLRDSHNSEKPYKWFKAKVCLWSKANNYADVVSYFQTHFEWNDSFRCNFETYFGIISFSLHFNSFLYYTRDHLFYEQRMIIFAITSSPIYRTKSTVGLKVKSQHFENFLWIQIIKWTANTLDSYNIVLCLKANSNHNRLKLKRNWINCKMILSFYSFTVFCLIRAVLSENYSESKICWNIHWVPSHRHIS